MGLRGYILLLEEAEEGKGVEGVYLYTHWGGRLLPLLVRVVLSKRLGWDCPPYLGRLLFSAMTHGKDETDLNFGIGASPFETDFKALVIDGAARKVMICDDDTLLKEGLEQSVIAEWSFEQFIDTDAEKILGPWNSEFQESVESTSSAEKLELVTEQMPVVRNQML